MHRKEIRYFDVKELYGCTADAGRNYTIRYGYKLPKQKLIQPWNVDAWQIRKLKIMEVFPNCYICGKKGYTVHHWDSTDYSSIERYVNSDRVITVCKRCHEDLRGIWGLPKKRKETYYPIEREISQEMDRTEYL